MVPVGARAADGRRQPGDHAVAQHGDHRLDDRRRRARLRRADARCAGSTSAAGWRPGIAIVVLAVALDRISQAYALRASRVAQPSAGRLVASAIACRCRRSALVARCSGSLGLAVPGAAAPIRQRCRSRPASYWDALVEWLNVNFFDTFEAIKTAVLLNVLVPVKRFLLAQPWPWAIAVVVAAALARSAAARRAAIAGAFCLFIAFTGNWEPAMVTVYLVGISVVDRRADRHPDRHRRRAQQPALGAWCRRSSTRCRRCRPSST